MKDDSNRQYPNQYDRIIKKMMDYVLEEHLAGRIRDEKIKHGFPSEYHDPWDLTDIEWQKVALQLYNASPKKSTGRPRADHRGVLSAIIWYLSMPGAQWRDLPTCFPSYKTVHRYYQYWKEKGTLYTVLDILQITPIREF